MTSNLADIELNQQQKSDLLIENRQIFDNQINGWTSDANGTMEQTNAECIEGSITNINKAGESNVVRIKKRGIRGLKIIEEATTFQENVEEN